MSPKSVTDICVMLVDEDSESLKKTLSQLVFVGYRVVTVFKGTDVLPLLRSKQNKVDLVLIRTMLTDICAFHLVEILDTEFNMPVVMISEEYHVQTILRGLLSGAMFCYEFPLYQTAIDNLWQHAISKKRHLQEELEAEMNAAIDYFESLAAGESSQNRKKTTNGLEIVEVSAVGLPSLFSWTNDLHRKFLEVVAGLGVDVASPLEVLHRIDVPGLTIEIVTEKLQQYRSFLRRQQRFPNQTQIQLMEWLGATRPLPYVLPDSLLMDTGIMPLANAAQIPVQPPAPAPVTVARVPLVISLPVPAPAPGRTEGETEEDVQVWVISLPAETSE